MHQQAMVNDGNTPIALVSPLMTKPKFSVHTGLREGQIKGQVERKHISTIFIGKHQMINVASLTWLAHPLLVSPVLTKDRFSDASGLELGQVESQIKEGNLPIHKIGRLILIDMTELARVCFEQALEEQKALEA
ncbi:MAG: hypothetical protein HRU20_31665 [Pseudomonadales bacterium]|nr:hypothetical protein [Pseudomonadales bacterium]